MTHTPASGPLALVTTPPRSVAPTWTGGAAGRCAWGPDAALARHTASPITITAIFTSELFLIFVSFSAFQSLCDIRRESHERGLKPQYCSLKDVPYCSGGLLPPTVPHRATSSAGIERPPHKG